MCRAAGGPGAPHGRRCPGSAHKQDAALQRRRENRAIGQKIARWAKEAGKAEELAELKARHGASDKRTQDTLTAVHATLEKVATRLAGIDGAELVLLPFGIVFGLVIAALTALLAGTWVAGAVLLTVMVGSALAATLGRPIAGRSAAAASLARARFGRAVVSSLESVRTIKLAAATPFVRRHLRQVDAGRVQAAVKEHRVQAVLDAVPLVMVQCGVVVTWWIHVAGGWGLGTAILVSGAVAGFDWFGRVASMVVTEAPGTRAWQVETARFAGGVDLMDLPAGVDLVEGTAPAPVEGVGPIAPSPWTKASALVGDSGAAAAAPLIGILRPRLSGFGLGRVTVSTPFLNSARTASGSTGEGRRTLRE